MRVESSASVCAKDNSSTKCRSVAIAVLAMISAVIGCTSSRVEKSIEASKAPSTAADTNVHPVSELAQEYVRTLNNMEQDVTMLQIRNEGLLGIVQVGMQFRNNPRDPEAGFRKAAAVAKTHRASFITNAAALDEMVKKVQLLEIPSRIEGDSRHNLEQLRALLAQYCSEQSNDYRDLQLLEKPASLLAKMALANSGAKHGNRASEALNRFHELSSSMGFTTLTVGQ